MKIVEWSKYEEFTSATKPPTGLSCALGCNPLLLLYVQSPTEPELTLLDYEHPDVRSISTVRNRTVGVLVGKLLQATFLNPDWRFRIEYNDAAVVGGTLLPSQICSVVCMDCEKQADSTGQTNENTGPAGPPGESSASNIDGGAPNSVYGGLEIIDGGAP